CLPRDVTHVVKNCRCYRGCYEEHWPEEQLVLYEALRPRNRPTEEDQESKFSERAQNHYPRSSDLIGYVAEYDGAECEEAAENPEEDQSLSVKGDVGFSECLW